MTLHCRIHASLAQKVLLNVSYKNPGKTDIKNLVMKLNGSILDKDKTVTIGNGTGR